MRGLLLDMLAVAGLGLIGTGLWWMSPAASLTVLGTLCLGLLLLAVLTHEEPDNDSRKH